MDRTGQFLFLVGLFLGVLVDVAIEAKKAEDCQIINMRHLTENVTSIFNESLRFSFTSDDDAWIMSATISDVNGTECQLHLKYSGNKRTNELACGSSVTTTEASIKQEEGVLFNDIWTDILIDSDACGRYTWSGNCKSQLRIIFTQFLVIDVYKPKWLQTPLVPPLTIHWNKKFPSDVVVNCDNKDCLVNSSILVTPKRDFRNSFFLWPNNSTQSLELKLEDGNRIKRAQISTEDLDIHAGNWINITVFGEENILKVLADGYELRRLNWNIKKFRITRVETKGEGLLTWCDPNAKQFQCGNQHPTVLNFRYGWTSLILMILPTIIAVGLFFPLIYFWTMWKKERQINHTLTDKSHRTNAGNSLNNQPPFPTSTQSASMSHSMNEDHIPEKSPSSNQGYTYDEYPLTDDEHIYDEPPNPQDDQFSLPCNASKPFNYTSASRPCLPPPSNACSPFKQTPASRPPLLVQEPTYEEPILPPRARSPFIQISGIQTSFSSSRNHV